MITSSGAFDVNRRSFLALLSATGIATVLPASLTEALASPEEDIAKNIEYGVWLKHGENDVQYYGLIESFGIKSSHFRNTLYTQTYLSLSMRSTMEQIDRLHQYMQTILYSRQPRTAHLAIRMKFMSFRGEEATDVSMIFKDILITDIGELFLPDVFIKGAHFPIEIKAIVDTRIVDVEINNQKFMENGVKLL